jgi:putative DNA primase/helicase
MKADTLVRDLATRFRLTKRPRSWAGDCPACGYPRAFSIRVGKTGRPSLYCANGCSRKVLDDEAGRAMGHDWTPRPLPDTSAEQAMRERKQDAALRLLAGSTACSATNPAGRYLKRRGLAHLIGCETLRYRDDCPHPEGGTLPALVAAISDVAGRPLAIHRTYLERNGHKASVDPVKASLGPVWGGAIRLGPIAAELVIGEGIETAASAGLLLSLPAWAAISAGNMATGLVLPPDVRAVVIAADSDPPGRAAAAAASARWQAEGRRVRIATPNNAGQDFNDLLQDGALAAVEAAHG